MSSLYLHIPFCERKCSYCAFASVVGNPVLFASYCTAVKKELEGLRGGALDTVFFGGGTPTCLSSEQLCDLLVFLQLRFDFAEDVEISVEVNPGTVDLPYLSSLRQAGVNRLSFGVQSFLDSDLKALGRIHTAEEARRSIKLARRAGFTNISLDLMYGLPGQTAESWEYSLLEALSLEPRHLSLYQLGPEKGTSLFDGLKKGRFQLPAEEEIEKMDVCSLRLVLEKGFEQYETSNFALPGFRCRHNIHYWHNESWWAVGASAVSYVAGCREKRVVEPQEYIARMCADVSPLAESEKLSNEAAFRETIIMGLRMIEGVELTRVEQRFGLSVRKHYGATLDKLVQQGVLEFCHTSLRLSQRGQAVANQVMAQLV